MNETASLVSKRHVARIGAPDRRPDQRIVRDLRPRRYRVVVLAPDISDVVWHAGGWLYDRARSGWLVTVLTDDDEHDDALTILGVARGSLRVALSARDNTAWPPTLAMPHTLLTANVRLRRVVVKQLQRSVTELAFWGSDPHADIGAHTHTAQHRLSSAAVAFKSRALAAAALPGVSAEQPETFHCGQTWSHAAGADLAPTAALASTVVADDQLP